MTLSSCLYAGSVMHHRFKPRRHRFTYSVVSALLDLSETEALNARLRLFSLNRFNLFSWYNRDHGDGTETPLIEQVRKKLEEHQLSEFGDKIKLLCYPRMFGYVFNPLSVYYCYDAQGRLGAVLYEVSNTFKERHTYLIKADPTQPDRLLRQRSDKVFYVSPFMPMSANYQFRLKPPQERVAVCIRQTQDNESLLHATFTGEKRELSDRSLLSTLVRYPMMTLKVIGGIHWEALRLWKKGVPLQKRQKLGTNRLTLGQSLETTRHETL